MIIRPSNVQDHSTTSDACGGEKEWYAHPMESYGRVYEDDEGDNPDEDGGCEPECGVSEQHRDNCFRIRFEIRRDGEAILGLVKSLERDEKPQPEVVYSGGDDGEDDVSRDLRPTPKDWVRITNR